MEMILETRIGFLKSDWVDWESSCLGSWSLLCVADGDDASRGDYELKSTSYIFENFGQKFSGSERLVGKPLEICFLRYFGALILNLESVCPKIFLLPR
jgi:hypothetical protein